MNPQAARPAGPNPLALSIVIPTYMRDQVLWDSVRAIGPQLGEGDELLVIDQNVPPLEAPPDLSADWLRLLHLDRPSLTRARNLGLAEARRDRVVFLDDDIVPDPDRR